MEFCRNIYITLGVVEMGKEREVEWWCLIIEVLQMREIEGATGVATA